MKKIKKEGKWVTYELFEWAIQNRLTICISLFSHHKKKQF